MPKPFDRDDHPGSPRILFVGWADSTHTHAWIDLVRDRFNVRLYALPRGFPPDGWAVRTYVTQSTAQKFDANVRRKLYPGNTLDRDLRNWLVRRVHGQHIDAPRLGLARVIRQWRPHVVHALGLDPAGWFTLRTREHFQLQGCAKWILQLRGGSDMALASADPRQRPDLIQGLTAFDVLLTDNRLNVSLAAELGVPRDRFASIVTVPGTGGLDLEAAAALWRTPPSSRADILWPKAYECSWSKSLPVLEALKHCQSALQERKIHMLAADEETRAWYYLLPAELRQAVRIHGRMPRDDVLNLMATCRVMLAPSLVDGVPNSLYEAMALGALPVVSPLETIVPVVKEEENVLFARNLYPEEIAWALIRAMEDDDLVDGAAERNLKLVARLADRRRIAGEVVGMYEGMVG